MENQDLDIPYGFEHLFPGAVPQRNKKRSSILKQLDANTDFTRDERKSMKRVSFAQHTVYQEVFPDGTINCIEKQLKAERTELNIERESQHVITSGLDSENVCPNISTILCSEHEVVSKVEINVNEEELKLQIQKPRDLNESKVDKVRKSKIATAFKSHMERNYNVNDEKDYDTLYNTSVNKYGREIVPREEKPDVTQLFQDIEAQMQLDTASISVMENVTKAFSAEDSGAKMSLDNGSKIDSEMGTKVFSSDVMDVSSNDDFKSLDTRRESNSSDHSSNEFVSLHNTTFFQTEENLVSFSSDDLKSDPLQIIAKEPLDIFEALEPLTAQTKQASLEIQEPLTEYSFQKSVDKTQSVQKSLEMTTVTPPSSQETGQQESEMVVRETECENDDMDCVSSDDTDTCSESFIESEESTKHFDDTMDVCSDDTQLSGEIKENNNLTEKESNVSKRQEQYKEQSVHSPFQSNVLANIEVCNGKHSAVLEKSANDGIDMTKNKLIVESETISNEEPIANINENFSLSTKQPNIHIEIDDEIIARKQEESNFVKPEPITNTAENNEAMHEKVTQSFEIEKQAQKNTLLKSQPVKLNILSKIQLPTTHMTSQCERSSIDLGSKVPVPTGLSFILPCSVSPSKKSFVFKKPFQRVSHLPKATINLRPSINASSSAFEKERNIDSNIEADWELTDCIKVHKNEQSVSEGFSLRPRLRKSFGFNIQEKLQKKREEIENKRKTIVISENLERSTIVSQIKVVDETSNTSVHEENVALNVTNSDFKDSREEKPENNPLNISNNQSQRDLSRIIENHQQTSETIPVISNNCSFHDDQNKVEDILLEEKPDKVPIESPKGHKRKLGSIENSEADCGTFKHAKGLGESVIKVTEDENGAQEAQELDVSLHQESQFINGSSTASVSKSHLLSESSFMNDVERYSNDDSLYDAFEKDSPLEYSSMNPFQFSFINKEDTLFLMAEELENTFEDDTEATKPSITFRKSSIESKYPNCCASLQQLDFKWMSENNVEIREVDESRASVAFMNGLFVLEANFDESDSTLKNVTHLKISFHFDSELKADGFLILRDDFFFDLTSKHKGLLVPVNFMVASLFEEIKSELLHKYPTTETFDKLITEVAQIMIRSEQLLMELRSQSAFHRFMFRKTDDNFEFVFVLRGICRNFYLVLPMNVKQYPFEVVTPKFCVHQSELHRYSLKSFSRALQEVPSGENYITRLIKSAKMCVKATKKVEFEKKKAIVQRV